MSYARCCHAKACLGFACVCLGRAAAQKGGKDAGNYRCAGQAVCPVYPLASKGNDAMPLFHSPTPRHAAHPCLVLHQPTTIICRASQLITDIGFSTTGTVSLKFELKANGRDIVSTLSYPEVAYNDTTGVPFLTGDTVSPALTPPCLPGATVACPV